VELCLAAKKSEANQLRCKRRRPVGRYPARAVLLLIACYFLFQPQAEAQLKEVRRVLILTEFGLESPGVAAVKEELVTVLENSPYQIEFYSENLDTTLFPDETSQGLFREEFIRRYHERKLDAIVVLGPSPIKFMAALHETYFPSIPIVFGASPAVLTAGVSLDPYFTGVWAAPQPEKTLETALRLQPSTEHIVVVGGVAPYDRYLEALAKERFRSYESKVDFTYLTELDMASLLERLKHLPHHTIVYHTSIMQDAKGSHFNDETQSVPLVADASTAPVFVADDVDLGRGTVGGNVFSFATHGRDVAGMVVRILNGEKPQDIPVVQGADILLFDWRALRRWGLNERNLPPGSVVLNREPTFWEQYKRYIIIGIFLLWTQALIILGLLWQRQKRRRVEAALRESEERFRLVANAAPVMIWMSGPDKLCTYVNQPWQTFTGRSIHDELGNGWAEGVHAEDSEQCMETFAKAVDQREPFEMEYRLRRYDGEYRWVLDLGVPRFNANGSLAGYIGSCLDVTERKLAEEALSSVSRRLIEAHEEERVWIARELHDDINQRLALLAVNMEGLGQTLSGSAVRRLQEQIKHVSEIGSEIQALSHRLHSSKLEYLGLTAAAASFCRELSGQLKVEIDFRSDDIPKDLSQEISLCLFRVLQEALQNAAKHSGSKRFQVMLSSMSNEIQLTVQDSGIGFDADHALKGYGLGLTSMKERLKLVDGDLSIDTQAQLGTTIRAIVSLNRGAKCARARAAS
jgi:PAS domain S-box-containing protein